MTYLRYTLHSDGSSDRYLLPIIDWSIGRFAPAGSVATYGTFADLRLLPKPATNSAERILAALKYFPCDLMFVHRDAERMSGADRIAEIERLVESASVGIHVPVVPVRMTEAWLLTDEKAIRRAADNPNGTVALNLPPIDRLERLPDPKGVLEKALRNASEKTGRRLDQFERHLSQRKHRVAESTADFSPLRGLPAFATFERLTGEAVRRLLTGR